MFKLILFQFTQLSVDHFTANTLLVYIEWHVRQKLRINSQRPKDLKYNTEKRPRPILLRFAIRPF